MEFWTRGGRQQLRDERRAGEKLTEVPESRDQRPRRRAQGAGVRQLLEAHHRDGDDPQGNACPVFAPVAMQCKAADP